MRRIDRNAKNFCARKFHSMLLTASVSLGMEYLMLLSDSIIIGNLFGEAAIAASNLVSPIFSVAVFVSSLISVGSSMLYSYEIGKFQKNRADRIFGQGVILAVCSGTVLFLLAFLGKNVYFTFMNPSETVMTYAREYYQYYQFLMLLYPMYALLIDMVYSEGDELICNLSYAAQVGVNIPISIFLCRRIGVGGASLGTLIGTVLSLAVLLLHFFRRQNSLKFVWHFSGGDLLNVIKGGLLDSVVYLLWGITACAANKYILIRFGDVYLPALSVIISVIELTILFDGIGQAITPLVNVYRGEENSVGIRKVMALAGRAAVVEGIGSSVLLFCFGKYLARMLGITDPGVLSLCETAIRLACPFLVCSALLFLLTTYYLLTEKLLLATWITLMKDCLAPVALLMLLGQLFGVNGIWLGFGLAPLLSLGITCCFITLKYGRNHFPLLLPEAAAEVRDFDLCLTEQSIIALRDSLEAFLTERNVNRILISRLMLLTEELGMQVLEKNPGKQVMAECTLILGKDLQLIFRDDGVLFDITDSDSTISSMRSYLLANIMVSQKRKHLVTTGYNRNAFRFDRVPKSEKEKET